MQREADHTVFNNKNCIFKETMDYELIYIKRIICLIAGTNTIQFVYQLNNSFDIREFSILKIY